jgi:hypothetical protein
MSTLKQTLENIHKLLAEDMLEVLTQGVRVVGEDGETTYRRPNAQEWNAICKFLKDNGIDRIPQEAPGADDPFAKLVTIATERTRTEGHLTLVPND